MIVRKIIIDSDTACDDAVAIIMALRNNEIMVEAITTVAGNVPVDIATKSAVVSVGIAESYVPPIYKGCSLPLCRDQVTVQRFEGDDAMGNLGLKFPDITVSEEHAVDALARMVKETEGIEVVALGPLTNIAMAIKMYPEAMKKLKRITVMGGQYHLMNPYTPTAEFNIYADPDAAEIVLNSGIHVDFVPMDPSFGEASFVNGEIDDILDLKTVRAEFSVKSYAHLIDLFEKRYGERMMVLMDPVAMAYHISPDIVTEKIDAYVQCETKSELTKGELVIDYIGIEKKPVNASIIVSVDNSRFKEMVIDALK